MKKAIRRLRALIPASLTLLTAFGAAQARDRVPPELANRAAREGAVRVIVQLDVPTIPEGHLRTQRSRRLQRQRIAAAQEHLSEELAGTHFRTGRRFRSIGFTAIEVGPHALDRLERSSRVLAVQEDRLHRPFLDVSAPLVEVDQVEAMGFDGSGQTVVVLDTGVDADHPNLAGKVVDEACFASGSPYLSGDCPNGLTFDDGEGSSEACDYSGACFHGTHVAGIAVGSGAAYSGVATGADLIPIQVFSEFSGSDCDPSPSPCARTYGSDLIAALEYTYDTLRSLHTIASVNMSLGGASHTSQALCDADNPATKAAIDNLRLVGIATVIASGNNGYIDAINEPGCISSAVSVGATDDDDQIASFSNAADFLSLWAPGVAIRAPLYGTTGFTGANGTSMATPHVAGAWAILRQAEPSASVGEILAALQDTGVPIPDVYADTTRIRIAQARVALNPSCSNGLDDDGDGLTDLADPGCENADDASERTPDLACDDGVDNDGDGLADFPEDPGCFHPSGDIENPQCQDGIDNDGDGKMDYDAGLTANGSADPAGADPQCVGTPWLDREPPWAPCGLGAELAFLMPPLFWLLARRRGWEGS